MSQNGKKICIIYMKGESLHSLEKTAAASRHCRHIAKTQKYEMMRVPLQITSPSGARGGALCVAAPSASIGVAPL